MKIKVRTCYQVSRLCVNYFRHQKVGVHSPSRIGRWHRLPQKLPYAWRFHDEIFQTKLENSLCVHWRFHDELERVAWTFGPPVCLGGFGCCKLDPCRSHPQLLFALRDFGLESIRSSNGSKCDDELVCEFERPLDELFELVEATGKRVLSIYSL